MKLRSFILFLALLLAAADIRSQNFDADSVYYTPIPVDAKKQVHHIKVFQDTVKSDKLFTYFFTLQVGPLIGCNDCSEGKEITFSAATVHGVTIGKKLRTGLGIGLDSYDDWQTMPVFGSLSWDVFGTKNTSAIFVQFNYGWSKSWLNKSQQQYGFKDADGGQMIGTQIGYRLMYHDIRISLSAGTKYQRVYALYEYPTYYAHNGAMVEGNPSTTTIQQSMNRFMITLSVGWK